MPLFTNEDSSHQGFELVLHSVHETEERVNPEMSPFSRIIDASSFRCVIAMFLTSNTFCLSGF